MQDLVAMLNITFKYNLSQAFGSDPLQLQVATRIISTKRCLNMTIDFHPGPYEGSYSYPLKFNLIFVVHETLEWALAWGTIHSGMHSDAWWPIAIQS